MVQWLKIRIFNAESTGPIYNPFFFFFSEKKTLHNLWLVASANAEPQCQMGKADRSIVYLQIFGICRSPGTDPSLILKDNCISYKTSKKRPYLGVKGSWKRKVDS